MKHKGLVYRHLLEVYGIQAEFITENKNGWQNKVYHIDSRKGQFVLRMTPKVNRNHLELTGELIWLTILKNWLIVPQLVLTEEDRLFSELNLNEVGFFSSVFERLPGKHLAYP